jgi:hypothetical protein
MRYNPLLATLALVLGGIIFFFVVTGVILGALASGDAGDPPGSCQNSDPNPEDASSPGAREVVTDPGLAAQFQTRWDEFQAQLDAGNPASVTFEESELTSRAQQWVDETDAPLDDVTICIYDGIAEARAVADIPYASEVPVIGGVYETNVRATGRIDLSGENPEVVIVDFEAGDIPEWATDPIQDDIEEAINDRLADYDIVHDYTVTYREGQLEIAGQP